MSARLILPSAAFCQSAQSKPQAPSFSGMIYVPTLKLNSVRPRKSSCKWTLGEVPAVEDIHKQPEPCNLTTNFPTNLRAAPLKKIGCVAELLYYTQVRIRRLFFVSLVILHEYKVSPTVIKCSSGEESFNLSRGMLYNIVNTEMNMYLGQKSVHNYGF